MSATVRQWLWFVWPILLCFAYWPGRLGDAYEPAKLLSSGLVVGLLLLSGARLVCAPVWRPLIAVGLLFLLITSIGSHHGGYAVFGSAQRFQGVASLLLCGLTVLLMQQADYGEQRAVRRGALCSLLLCVLLLLAQRLGIDPLDTAAPRPPGALGNAVIQAQALLLLTALAWPHSGDWSPAALRKARWVVGIGGLLGIMLTGTRAALLAVLMVTAAALLLRAMCRAGAEQCSRPNQPVQVLRWFRHGGMPLVIMPLVILLISVVLAIALLLFWHLRPESGLQRLQLWHSAVAAIAFDFQHTPWRTLFGHGPDQAFVALLPAWEASQHGPPPGHLDRAHQWFMDTWLSYGVAGLLWLVWMFWRLARKPIWHSAEHRMAGLGLLAWGLSLQVSFALSADSLLACLLLGGILAGFENARAPLSLVLLSPKFLWPKSLHSAARPALGLAICLASAWLWWLPASSAGRAPEQALHAFTQAQQILAEGAAQSVPERTAALADAELALNRAVTLDPLRREYALALQQVRRTRSSAR